MPNQDIELRWIIAVIRRRWWLIILMVLLATVTAYIVTQNIPPVYEASTTLLISPAQNSTASLLNELMASERLALTYSQMMKERPVLDIVRSQLDLEQSTEELVKNVQAQPVRDTQLIQLTVSDSDPDRAALIANTIAEIFKARVELLSAERYAATIDNAQTRVDRLETQVGDSRGGSRWAAYPKSGEGHRSQEQADRPGYPLEGLPGPPEQPAANRTDDRRCHGESIYL
jgi:capsular polysaccharide biosynthesis protein